MSLCPNNSIGPKKEREFGSRELPSYCEMKLLETKEKIYSFPYPCFTFIAQIRNKDR